MNQGTSALLGAGFPEYNLEFTRAGGGGMIRDPDGGFDEDGNPLYVPDPGSKVSLTVKLKPTSDPRIIALVGSDTSVTPLKGLCLAPTRVPEGIIPPAECELVMNGIPGVFTLLPWFESQHSAALRAVGQRIIGQWRPT